MREELHTRRALIAGVGAGGLAVTLAACGADGGTGAAPASSAPASTPESAAASTPASAPASSPAGGADALTTTAEVPVGGGTIFKDKKVVVTQPTAGEFKCFSAMCTHQGCAVGSVTDGTIVCPCHNSRFSIADGSVKGGPATKPLPEQAIKVEGDTISLA
ncbi:Rieske (2Fe-2S) protein [Nonomuraea sp. NPDC050310]|uniref:Rieske (2Fe-2S) protein n=1 Tax=Nonomuraea sp. NPDC050310 TaxID=3154935 RepID=UPI0033EDEDAD